MSTGESRETTVTSGVPESSLSYAEIEKAAEEFARLHEFDSQTCDIRDLVHRLGGELDVAILPDSKSDDGGSMDARRDGPFVIHLSPFTGVLRDNFTIAHELGHFSLHVPLYFKEHPDRQEVRVNRFGADKPELQANRFAAALLMPAAKFREIAEQVSWSSIALSVHFSVSQAAAQYRADFLRR